jgi:hypothetical protein
MAWWVPERLRQEPPPPAPPPDPPPLLSARYLKLYPLLGIALSALLVPCCASLLNHDHFLLPMLLFPLPMAAILNIGGELPAFCILSALQFPLYGLFLGYGRGINGLPSFSAALAIAHALSIGFSFMSLL